MRRRQKRAKQTASLPAPYPWQVSPPPPTPWMAKYIDEIQAAAILGVSRKSMQNWRWRGVGPTFHRFETAIRYELGELLAYAAERRVQSTTEADQLAERKAADAEL